MNIIVRKAKEEDRKNIAFCISEGFKNDFSAICKNVHKVALALESGIKIDKFYVACNETDFLGAFAISDCDARAASTDKKAYRKQFGLIKGWIASIVLKGEFEKAIEYPKTVGYLEFVCVREEFRRNKVATKMIIEGMKLSNYNEFVLDVTDTNIKAFNCYSAIGFKQFKTVEEPNSKYKGFNSRIYMQYNYIVTKE